MLEMVLQRTVPFTLSGAGGEISVAVPAGSLWELLAVKIRLASSAVAGSRTSTITVTDPDGNRIQRYAPGGSQAAGVTVDQTFGAGLGATPNAGSIGSALIPGRMIVPAGHTIATVTGSLDAGDTYTSSFVIVRDWSLGRIRGAIRTLLADLDSIGGIR